MDDRTRQVLERAAAAAERRKKEQQAGQSEDSVASPRSCDGQGAGDASEPSLTATGPTVDNMAPAVEVVEVASSSPTLNVPAVGSKWSVGDVILAAWQEDGLFYRARVDQVRFPGTPQESYSVTFIEYGNAQPDTPVAATALCPPNLVTQVAAPLEGSSVEEEIVALKQEEKSVLEKEIKDAEEAARSTTSSSSPLPVSATEPNQTSGDTTKKGGKGKVKEMFGKLTTKKKKEEESARLNIVTTVSWKKIEVDVAGSETGATTIVSPGRRASPPPLPPVPPVPAEKPHLTSPRRPPPAPPVAATLVATPVVAATVAPLPEELEPLPPIVSPTSLLDYLQVGHLFVALCDLRRLHCDAWVVPTGLDFVPATYWFLKPTTSSTARNYTGTGGSGLKYFGKDSRVKRAPGWPDERPVPYMIGIERRDSTTLEWLLTPVKQFLEVATAELQGTKPARGRFKHLIALPLVGTGAAGLPERKGDVIHELLPVLLAHARDRNVDIVLTTNEPPIWSAIQSARAKLADQFAIPGKLLSKADELARYSRAGKLALFVGAGVSIGAGLPSWGGLLSDLMEKASMSPDERKLMADLSLLDQANVLQRRMGAAAFSQSVADRLRSHSYSLSHSLLASLNADSVVSTNYDTLFEDASRDAGKPCAVLPYSPSRDMQRFVLKMHGDVNHAEDIVLTREDYLRYNNMRAALAGIVQSLLITKHFLFVGFSLTDDNFLKIVDQVRQAMGEPAAQAKKKAPIGSATFLFDNSLFAELWSDIDIISMTTTGKDFARAGNALEIFLDFLSFRSLSNSNFLMEPHFDALLTAEDRAFKASLTAWMESFPKEARQSQSFTLLKGLLRREFGGLKIAE